MPAKAATKKPVGDAKVHAYLAFIQDPNSVLNAKEIAKAQKAFDTETDPAKKLLARKALTEAQTPDGTKVTADFISVAKRWAEAQDLDADVFIDTYDVPRTVLRDAGFDVRVGVYKARVKGNEVRDYVLTLKGPWEITDVVTGMTEKFGVGPSNAGARNAIAPLLDEKKIIDIGPDPDRFLRGKPPTRYEVAPAKAKAKKTTKKK